MESARSPTLQHCTVLGHQRKAQKGESEASGERDDLNMKVRDVAALASALLLVSQSLGREIHCHLIVDVLEPQTCHTKNMLFASKTAFSELTTFAFVRYCNQDREQTSKPNKEKEENAGKLPMCFNKKSNKS